MFLTGVLKQTDQYTITWPLAFRMIRLTAAGGCQILRSQEQDIKRSMSLGQFLLRVRSRAKRLADSLKCFEKCNPFPVSIRD